MTYKQLIDDYIPVYECPCPAVNANALKVMAEGIHYDTEVGELNPDFAFIQRVDRVDAPAPILRWQRSLPGVRVVTSAKPRPSRRKMLAKAG